MNLHFLLLLLLQLTLLSVSSTAPIGINYGQLGNNLPSPSTSIKLINSLNANFVKIYDANPKILQSLSNTNLQVSVMVPNQLIINISSNQDLANTWVDTNVLPFYPKTNIQYVLVGNEILSSWQDPKIWPNLVPAMTRIKKALEKCNLLNIKVSTPHAMDVLQSSFPPSSGAFRSDISSSIIKPMLSFLSNTKSDFFLDVYTYFPWSSNPNDINLNYALLEKGNITYTDPVSKLTYNNLLDQMLDSVIFAMKRLGFPDIKLFIAETGWPSAGDVDQIGANLHNAATYNRNLIQKLTNPPVGTPARPGVALPTLIFSLYNENQKPGATTERNWGLFYPNESKVYDIKFTQKQPEYSRNLPAPDNNKPYKGSVWCVVASGMEKNKTELSSALSYACGQGKGTCDAIQPGKNCYRQGNLDLLASYGFSSYWAQFKSSGGTCYFNGLAVQTTKNPGFGDCKFPSIQL